MEIIMWNNPTLLKNEESIESCDVVVNIVIHHDNHVRHSIDVSGWLNIWLDIRLVIIWYLNVQMSV